MIITQLPATVLCICWLQAWSLSEIPLGKPELTSGFLGSNFLWDFAVNPIPWTLYLLQNFWSSDGTFYFTAQRAFSPPSFSNNIIPLVCRENIPCDLDGDDSFQPPQGWPHDPALARISHLPLHWQLSLPGWK